MRLSIDDYLWSLAFKAAERSTCDRFMAGCVVARDGKVLSTGYNGSADGDKHCDEAGHEMVQVVPLIEAYAADGEPYLRLVEDDLVDHCIRTIHAEVNAIINAAYHGICIAKADWYVNGVSCMACAKAISRLKPNRIFFCLDNGPESPETLEWFKMRVNTVRLHKADLVSRGVIDG